MHSSISSSEGRGATRAIAVLVTGLFLYFAALEGITRRSYARVSPTQRRIHEDLSAAKSIAAHAANDPPTMLVVGNSLLQEGVDRASLKSGLAPNYVVVILPIENTQFVDWYFALRRLFAEGSRPSVVVLSLSTWQTMSRGTYGEYFAYYLMQGRDLLEVKKESQLDNTMTSAYFFANRSKWLGSRAQIRKALLQKIMPNVERLIPYFPGRTPPMPPKEEVVAGVLAHLLALDELCRANGARLVAIVPPTLSEDAATAAVQDSAARAGMSVLVPLRSNEVTKEDFRDAFHLNQRGAARFTPRLASALLQALHAN